MLDMPINYSEKLGSSEVKLGSSKVNMECLSFAMWHVGRTNEFL